LELIWEATWKKPPDPRKAVPESIQLSTVLDIEERSSAVEFEAEHQSLEQSPARAYLEVAY
jgi:hypothetical protein